MFRNFIVVMNLMYPSNAFIANIAQALATLVFLGCVSTWQSTGFPYLTPVYLSVVH